MSGVKRIAVASSALLVVALAASAVSSRRQSGAITNVVIVTLDTTRADHLSPYGFMDVRMPHLERLAREGVLFNRALTVAPLTLPAHTSILTGLLPASHGVRDNADAM
jgi:arylsulfatase A-like enzyme